MLTELVVIVPHPNIITHGLHFNSQSATGVDYTVNDILGICKKFIFIYLGILILIRCYLLARVSLNTTVFASTRA